MSLEQALKAIGISLPGMDRVLRAIVQALKPLAFLYRAGLSPQSNSTNKKGRWHFIILPRPSPYNNSKSIKGHWHFFIGPDLVLRAIVQALKAIGSS